MKDVLTETIIHMKMVQSIFFYAFITDETGLQLSCMKTV
jgi:hypothetical protein